MAQIAGWAIAGLVTIDVAANWLFRYPQDVNTPPNTVQRYFDYGRSTEGKLRRMFGPTRDSSAPITKAGWLDAERFAEEPTQVQPDDNLMIATYGMSFSQLLGFAIADTQPDVTVRNIRAPEAPANWAYAAFDLDQSAHQADAVVLTVMSHGVDKLRTMTGNTVSSDIPYPYTQPRYQLQDGELQATWPNLVTEMDFRRALQEDDAAWQTFNDRLANYDPYYSTLNFRQSVLDASALFRLARRAYVQTGRDRVSRRVYNASTGFNPQSQEVQVLQALIRAFAAQARQQNKVPILYLVNNIGYQDHLDQALIPLLEAENIPYVSSTDFAPINDPRLFQGDGHFLPEIDDAIAAEVVKVARQNLAK